MTRPATGEGRRVLVVDDDPICRRTTALLLESLGYAVEAAADGVAAVAAVRRVAFDVVLMDVEMPRLDGLEAARRIRGGPYAGEHAPRIVILSGAQQAVDLLPEAPLLDGWLQKPVDRDDLGLELDRVLGRGG